MRTFAIFLLPLYLAFAGCKDAPDAGTPAEGSSSTPAENASAPAAAGGESEAVAAPAAALEKKVVEVACATCIYHMEGVSGCKTAAKVDGKMLLVSGEGADAHGLGLCQKAMQAEVSGTVEGDKLVATHFEAKN